MPTNKQYADSANEQFGSDEVEIDPDNIVSKGEGEDGAWVKAWIWVYDEDANKK